MIESTLIEEAASCWGAEDPVIGEHLRGAARVLEETIGNCSQQVSLAARLIFRCFRAGGKLLICGNGGSAAESQHLAAEFTHRLSSQVIRRALPAMALTTDTSLLTAVANDCGFEGVFARQVEALGQPGDVLLGLSTSGASANVLLAMKVAHELRMGTVALMGESGPLADVVDVAICIPSRDTQHVQEAHLPVLHLLCRLVEREFVGVRMKDEG